MARGPPARAAQTPGTPLESPSLESPSQFCGSLKVAAGGEVLKNSFAGSSMGGG